MANAVSTSTNANATFEGGSNMTLVASDGTAFVLYYSGTAMVYRSAVAPYSSWSAATTLPSSGSNRYAASAHINSDDSIDVVYHVSGSGITYVKLTYNSGTHSWSNGTSHLVTATGGSGSSGEAVHILRDVSTTRIWVLAQQSNTSWEAYYSTDGTTWTASLTGAAMSNQLYAPRAAAIGNYVVAIAGESSNGNMTWRRVDTTGTLTAWSAVQSVQLGNVAGFGTFWGGDNSAFVADGSGKGVAVWDDTAAGFASGISAAIYDPATDTWSGYINLHAGAGGDDQGCCVVNVAGDVYAFWCERAGTNSQSIQYRKWDHIAASWGTKTQLEASGVNNAYPNAGFGSNAIVITFTQGTASPWTVYADSLSTASSSSRTVIAAVATLATYTRSVPTALAASGALVRTVVTQVATLTSGTRTVPTTLATSLSSTRTVPAAVAALATRGRTVAAVVSAMATRTRTVPTALATSGVGNQRIVGATIATILVQTRTVPTTLVAGLTSARTVGTSVATFKTGTRTVATAISTQAPITRTVLAKGAARGMRPMPVASHGVPVFVSDNATDKNNANDTNYLTTWRSNRAPSVASPVLLTYDLSGLGLTLTVIDLINQLGGEYYNTDATNSISLFKDYKLQGNTAAGGSLPGSGWVDLVTVTSNFYPQRTHAVDLTGYNWLRFACTAANGVSPNNDVMLQMDVHDASKGTQETFLMLGDSITAEATGVHNIDGSEWNYGGWIGQVVNGRTSGLFWPIVIDGGNGGMTMDWAATNIAGLLANYAGMFVVVAFGTNDCNLSFAFTAGDANVQAIYADLLTVLDACVAAGKKVIIPYIPWGDNNSGNLGINANLVNQYVDAHLFVDRPAANIWRGPDFYTFFDANHGLIRDHIHPTYLEVNGARSGYEEMIDQYATWMLSTLYDGNVRLVPTAISTVPSTLRTVVTAIATQTPNLTRTVPSAVAARSTALRTVPTAIATTLQLSRTVVSAVAAQSTSTRTVPTTLSANIATATRTVLTRFAVLVMAQRTVGSRLSSANLDMPRTVPTRLSASSPGFTVPGTVSVGDEPVGSVSVGDSLVGS